jgi:hypothetical protein
MDPITPARPRSRKLRDWLFVDTALSLLAIVPVAVFGMMSVMATDAGVNTAIMTFIGIALSFPVAVVLCPVLAWIAFALRRERTALVLSLLPVLWVVAILVMFVIGFGDPHPV